LTYTYNLFARFGNYVNLQDPKKFVLGVILNYNIDGVVGAYLSENQLEYAQIQFLNLVVNAQGEVRLFFFLFIFLINSFPLFKPLTGTYPIQPSASTSCDLADLQSVLDTLDSTISQMSSYNGTYTRLDPLEFLVIVFVPNHSITTLYLVFFRMQVESSVVKDPFIRCNNFLDALVVIEDSVVIQNTTSCFAEYVSSLLLINPSRHLIYLT
jgi:hypothetical protein